MLKALELTGFKSFADRTRFDFPEGITVVVGPNGSGKSNVVDAVKWVLGAQSAKSLRGSDMADVIFKGSAEGGRKPANSAEVVLILDNSRRLFHFDADEVHVSRRVFRSGESEFTINNNPCRLKDVKDLFRGTGVGVDAYSLIEQGKVDRLLQASAKERRGIFEEAAGISRFKAKKVEAERRLSRVDQNMLRLKDIVDEVGNRLNTLKSQAARANRYRELTNSLQIKRQQLGWLDRNALYQEQEKLIRQIESSRAEEEKLKQNLKELEAIASSEKLETEELQRTAELQQQELLEEQRVLIAAEGGYATAKEREVELHLEQNLLRERIVTLEKRVSLTADEISQKVLEIQSLDFEHQDELMQLQTVESESLANQSQLSELKSELVRCSQLLDQLREESVSTRSQITGYQLHVQQLTTAIAQQQSNRLETQNELFEFENSLAVCEERLQTARHTSNEANRIKSEAEDQVQRCRLALLSAQEQLIALQGKLHGLRERLLVLEQLENQFAGGERGGQQLLRLAKENRSPSAKTSEPAGSIGTNAWDSIIGLVADSLTTELHLAPLIDVALGAHADAIVLSNGQMIDWINHGNVVVDGRVTLIRMDRLTSRRTGEKIQLDGLRGVLGRADRMTRYDPAFEPLIRFLLGTTWFVDTLSTALELSHFRGAGLRFVTAECQLVESDGSITLGSLQSGLGLVSRRSEMQSAREQIAALENAISVSAANVTTRQVEIVEAESWLRTKENEAHEAAKELTACELRLENELQRREKLKATLDVHHDGLIASENRLEEIRLAISNADINLVNLSNEINREEDKHQNMTEQVKLVEARVVELQAIVTDRRVRIARMEQRLQGLRITLEQMQQDSAERELSAEQSRQAMLSLETKLQANSHVIEENFHRAANSKTRIASMEVSRAELGEKLHVRSMQLQDANRNCESARRALERGVDRAHSLENQIDQLKSQWETLHLHYTQEYQIQLEQLAEQFHEYFKDSSLAKENEIVDPNDDVPIWISDLYDDSQAEFDALNARTKIESEINLLRQEIASAGNVNMEALKELDDLQSRFDRLSNHYRDLDEARNSLISTMNKIDEDSREMFLETLHAIRRNFQDLYRRSFGGGFADIVLENEQDSESGIEIVATPPGKTTLSNTLLSGGEKALTAVALIMAFFQYRPSPFCILDEVDAPFDEANIGRFVTVLREFLDSTKFIVVTHSKKTMTAANMIYGITMQESGVSRQVSVRFEEVDDRGEIISSKRAA